MSPLLDISPLYDLQKPEFYGLLWRMLIIQNTGRYSPFLYMDILPSARRKKKDQLNCLNKKEKTVKKEKRKKIKRMNEKKTKRTVKIIPILY